MFKEKVQDMRLTVNGEAKEFNAPLTVTGLLSQIGLDPAKVAVDFCAKRRYC